MELLDGSYAEAVSRFLFVSFVVGCVRLVSSGSEAGRGFGGFVCRCRLVCDQFGVGQCDSGAVQCYRGVIIFVGDG